MTERTRMEKEIEQFEAAIEERKKILQEELTAFDKLIHSSVMDTYNSNGKSVSRTSRELGLHRSVIYRHLRFARQGVK